MDSTAEIRNDAPSGAMREATRRAGRRVVLPWVVLALGLTLAFLLFGVMKAAVDDVARSRFERDASDATSAIERRVEFYANVLYGLRALFASNSDVGRVDFHRFVDALDLPQRYPGLDVVNFAAHVPGPDRQRFEASVRADTSLSPSGYPQFSVRPPGERPEYLVIVYVEPMEGHEFAFGIDLYASPAVAQTDSSIVAALQQAARDSGRLTASGLPVRIAPEQEYARLMMRLAVYRSGMPLDTVDERRAAYLGSVGAGLNVGNVLAGALDDDTAAHLRFRLYDTGSFFDAPQRVVASADRLLYDSHAVGAASIGTSTAGEHAAATRAEQGPRTTQILPLEVGGRRWEIHFTANNENARDRFDTLLPWAILIGGVVSSGLLCGVLYSLACSRSRALAIAEDITGTLSRSEASLAQAQRTAHLGNWLYEPATAMMTCSAETYRIFGLEPQSGPVPLADFLQRVHGEDRMGVKDAICGAHDETHQREIEHRIVTADGAVRCVHTIVEATPSGAPARGTVMDITERKLAEEELLRSRALLNDAQKLSHVGCCQYNPGNGNLLWSEELYRIHGVEQDSFTPTYGSTMALVHPEDRAAWGDALAQALRSGAPFASEFRIVRPDASVRHLRSLGEVILDRDGRATSMLWSVLDITEQKHTEDALRDLAAQLTALSRRLVEVQEAERRQLSRELHDRVGQNLTALSINLDLLKTALSEDAKTEHRARLADSAGLLEATVDTIEDVMAELRPPMLDDYGLLPALGWYGKGFSERTGIHIEVLGAEGTERPRAEIEITLFRIAQEALNNVAKHSRAGNVRIELDQSKDHCVMTVTDDGIGIGIDGPSAAEVRERHGLGMLTMRERAQAVGGRFQVRNGPRGGTQLVIEIQGHGADTHTDRG
jgi:signal transduction histidine kinase/CHASE1-domain containing sensor protein